MRTGTFHFLTPTYKPVGGVVKILDYVSHARHLGFSVSVWCPEPWSADLPLFSTERIAALAEDPAVEWHSRQRLDIRRDDLCFVSLPDNFEIAYSSLPRGFAPDRIVHIIQGVRHSNPLWRNGYPLRLLTRPASRISINSIVAAAIKPHLDDRALHEVISVGHDVDYFGNRRDAPLTLPIKVASTTWKSDIGERAAALLDDRFETRLVTETVGWPELRKLYAWADVFLAAPGPEEGLYLPGVEAMAAGCILVTPDAGGNMAYCRPGNCIMVAHEAEAEYVQALAAIASMPEDEVRRMRACGYETAAGFSLDHERTQFGAFVRQVWQRVEESEGDVSRSLG